MKFLAFRAEINRRVVNRINTDDFCLLGASTFRYNVSKSNEINIDFVGKTGCIDYGCVIYCYYDLKCVSGVGNIQSDNEDDENKRTCKRIDILMVFVHLSVESELLFSFKTIFVHVFVNLLCKPRKKTTFFAEKNCVVLLDLLRLYVLRILDEEGDSSFQNFRVMSKVCIVLKNCGIFLYFQSWITLIETHIFVEKYLMVWEKNIETSMSQWRFTSGKIIWWTLLKIFVRKLEYISWCWAELRNTSCKILGPSKMRLIKQCNDSGNNFSVKQTS